MDKVNLMHNQPLRTFGSYNILYPKYAVNWNEKEGLVSGTRESNWEIDRKQMIIDIIYDSDLGRLCP